MKLPLVTLFDSMWGNLEKCHQFDDGTRQMMKPAYQEALTDNACPNLLKLQKEAGLLWNKAGENEFTSACHLAPLLPPTPPPIPPGTSARLLFQRREGGEGGVRGVSSSRRKGNRTYKGPYIHRTSPSTRSTQGSTENVC